MRKNGWQLPYHPLQVVAVAVFLALGFAFYVFFAPFVGKKLHQYIVMAIYSPLMLCVFGLYISCAATDPADPGVFKSKKYMGFPEYGKFDQPKDLKLCKESTSSMLDKSATTVGAKPLGAISKESNIESKAKNPLMLLCTPCASYGNCFTAKKQSSELQSTEEGLFCCHLCEVEVLKDSKHCRLCDKCVDRFDHHCRWLNNCIGKKNYRRFFTLMVSALLLLILQSSTGIRVLICCFLDRNRFTVEISSKLGSSFSLLPFVTVVVVCTILAMIATLPIAQLLFFHILLINKGISTYDYVVALREQEQQGGGHSPQMSTVSSLTGLSSASSYSTFHRAAWCTPPPFFLEDQLDVVPPDNGSVGSYGKWITTKEPLQKKKPQVKISPWKLARLDAEEVSKAAATAKKKSKTLQPVVKRGSPFSLEPSSSTDRCIIPPRLDSNNKRRANKRTVNPPDFDYLMNITTQKSGDRVFSDTSTSLAPLQLEARSAFKTSKAMSNSNRIVLASSPESSLDSPDIHPFEDSRRVPASSSANNKEIPLSSSVSDGYEASGGEDSDRVPSRSTYWSTLKSRHLEKK